MKFASLKTSAFELVEEVFSLFAFARNMDLYKSKFFYDATADVSTLTLIDKQCHDWLERILSASSIADLNQRIHRAILLAENEALYGLADYQLYIKPVVINSALSSYVIHFRLNPTHIRSVTITYDETSNASDMNVLLRQCEPEENND